MPFASPSSLFDHRSSLGSFATRYSTASKTSSSESNNHDAHSILSIGHLDHVMRCSRSPLGALPRAPTATYTEILGLARHVIAFRCAESSKSTAAVSCAEWKRLSASLAQEDYARNDRAPHEHQMAQGTDDVETNGKTGRSILTIWCVNVPNTSFESQLQMITFPRLRRCPVIQAIAVSRRPSHQVRSRRCPSRCTRQSSRIYRICHMPS